ncbi:MAG: PHP domain-containing protein, partial [Ruminococcus sp.]|nr:PHP domain-containing protein [Ruminococcus sp.]
MNIQIKDFLAEYNIQIPENVGQGDIYRITYSEDYMNIAFFAHFSQMQTAADCAAFEHNAAEVLKINSVKLNPRYEESLFGMEVMPEIIAHLKRILPLVNGFLDDADITIDGGDMRISLKHGGADILERGQFSLKLPRLIYNQFGVKMRVIIEGQQEVGESDFNDMVETVSAELPDYSSQFAPEPPGDMDDAPAPVVPTRSIDANAENIGYDPESAEIIKGKAIREKPISIAEAMQKLGSQVVVRGDVFGSEFKELKSGKTVATISITDYTGSLMIKSFVDKDDSESLDKLSSISKKGTVLVSGRIDYDSFAHDITISGDRSTKLSILKVKKVTKKDNYPEKRVELHCHTNMSAMDAVTDPVTLITRAAEWGHQAMAITDHGCVQAFPDCMYNMPKNFKVIYGCEAYVVNDIDRELILKAPDERSLSDEIIVFDVETTGLSFANDRLTEIGAVKLKNLQVVDSFNTKVNPGFHIPEKITELTGISDADVADAPGEAEAIRMLMEFCGENPVLAAHNASFDTTMINEAIARNNIDFPYNWLDTLILCQAMLPDMGRHKLNLVAKQLKLGKFDHHRASDDAMMLAKIYIELVSRLKSDRGYTALNELNQLVNEIEVKKLKSYHHIILVRNQAGLKNLYKLVSYSNLNYFYKKPLIPKSVLQEHREGLI